MISGFSLQIFEKKAEIFFIRTDRQTGRDGATGFFFRNFAKAPKNDKTTPNLFDLKLAAELF